eukprot:TRINITY_DN4232_c0_g1_i1.p1 TRINITY_DN4232_c0_g1~~TRINITY_DN4232_c0_g1_i1.p1  ORF type:complete len:344 (+),score=96.97 TRINITY_DN4232_c0_g1_i1:135-1034(+)
MTLGMYPGIKKNITLGSDGCGVVERVNGTEAQKAEWMGKTVILNSVGGWGDDPHFPNPATFTILGMPVNGTFAHYIVIDIDRLHLKPPHLTPTQAASICLAGHTAYRALFTKAKINKGDIVGITGIGGGVALFILQFAVAAGATVYVTSGSSEKLNRAVSLGASGGALYTEKEWPTTLKKVMKGKLFDAVIDGTGGQTFEECLRLLKPGGKIVSYGATAGSSVSLDLPRMFLMQKEILGSTMGNDSEFVQMVEFVNQHRLVPVVDSVLPFPRILEHFEAMKTSSQFGKLVVSMEPSPRL